MRDGSVMSCITRTLIVGIWSRILISIAIYWVCNFEFQFREGSTSAHKNPSDKLQIHAFSAEGLKLKVTVVLKVGMSCQGCAGAVNRVLGKMEGVESFDIDLKEQKVTVKGNVQADEVLQAVSKTGKKTAFWVDEAPAENKPSETAPVASAENDTKPSETAPVAPEIKPSETEPVASAEPENKTSETAIETAA
ncbi:Copper transport protein [Vigna angularis]|uniref:Copper transport protein n=1 Tax=Phaseolus angularis TaxID=3914 RepID=A0A8T0KW12_PHAAN|nr:Copper transport protein [Vigna angularis]